MDLQKKDSHKNLRRIFPRETQEDPDMPSQCEIGNPLGKRRGASEKIACGNRRLGGPTAKVFYPRSKTTRGNLLHYSKKDGPFAGTAIRKKEVRPQKNKGWLQEGGVDRPKTPTERIIQLARGGKGGD